MKFLQSGKITYLTKQLNNFKTRAHRALTKKDKPETLETLNVAQVATRAATLMRGGIMLHRVFPLLATEMPALKPLARKIEEGEPLPETLARTETQEWRLLASALWIAQLSGAPAAGALERIAQALTGLARARERGRVLLAGPASTARTVLTLPPIALTLGWLLGFDPFTVLFNWPGIILAVVGIALLAAGTLWVRKLTTKLRAAERVAGMEFELAVIALKGGAAPQTVTARIAKATTACHCTWITTADLQEDAPLARTLALAQELGAPANTLLLNEAVQARATVREQLEKQVERFAVQILAPLGVCVLPSFIALGVLPIVFAMFTPEALNT